MLWLVEFRVPAGAEMKIVPDMAFVGIARAMHPTQTAIGTHPGVTVVFALGAVAFWLSTLLFLYTGVLMLVHQSKAKGQKYIDGVRRLRRILFFLYPLCGALIVVAAGGMPMAMLLVDKTQATSARWQMYGFALGHYIGLAMTMVVLGVFFVCKIIPPLELSS